MSEPYRDDTSAAAEKLRQIEEELTHIDRVAAGREALVREAAELRRRLEAARARGPLEDLRIASSCKAKWEEMDGDDRVRHCFGCDKQVFNLSGMTRAEAIDLVKGQTGQSQTLCVRMYRRADGTVLTSDCPTGAKRKRVRRLVMVGASAAAASVAALWSWQESTVMGELPVGDPIVMGGADRPPAVDSATLPVPELGTPAKAGSEAPTDGKPSGATPSDRKLVPHR